MDTNEKNFLEIITRFFQDLGVENIIALDDRKHVIVDPTWVVDPNGPLVQINKGDFSCLKNYFVCFSSVL